MRSDTVPAMCRSVSFAAIGLVNMLNAGGAVRALKTHGNKGIDVQLHGAGSFLAYSSAAPHSVQVSLARCCH